MIWTNKCFCGATNKTERLAIGKQCYLCGGFLTYNEWHTEDGRPVQVFFEQIRTRKKRAPKR